MAVWLGLDIGGELKQGGRIRGQSWGGVQGGGGLVRNTKKKYHYLFGLSRPVTYICLVIS
jgi:hypothetical protein